MTAPFLLADIGGTSSRLALSDGPRLRSESLRILANDSQPDPATMIAGYLAETGARPGAVCLAAAGPVTGDTVRLTNRAWSLSRAEIEAVTGCAAITLMNDLQAMGHALAAPQIAGSPLRQPRLVLAIGTGINAAVAHPLPDGSAFVPAAEHGYLTLPFTHPDDASLLAALVADFGSPAMEAGLSGAGLARVHRLLTGETRPPQDIAAGAHGTEASLSFVLRLLGAVLGSLALVHMPHGGIWLAGSVGRALFAHLDRAEFREAYGRRGAYSDLIAGFPLHVIEDDSAPLHGAALCLSQALPGTR